MEKKHARNNDQRTMQETRLRALADMASGIAHDFNNSLTVIQGFVELMLMAPDSLDDRRTTLERLRKMQAAAKKGAETVDRMRAFYRESGADEVRMPVQLRGLIEEVISTTRPRWREQAMAAGRTVRIKKEIHGEPTVTANRTELRDVLTTLVVNALDALEDADGTITISARPDETAAVIAVGDTGRGMAEETRRRCFDPYFTTKKSAENGMGLSVACGIVERHGGAIEVRSAPGAGARFTVRLPATARSAAGAAPSGAPAACRPLTVLVVEDDPDVRLLITTYLAGAGHTVVSAADGVGGLERFEHGRFDLVVTDLAMPNMPGDRFASSLKRVAPDTPILMLTGFGDMMDTVRDEPPPVDAVLTKPVSKDQLLEEVAAVTRTAACSTDRQTAFKGNEHG